MEEVNIIPIDPVTFEYQEYSETDNQLIVSTPTLPFKPQTKTN